VPLIFALVSGKSFAARYCLVWLAPQIALSATAATKWLATMRTGRVFLCILVVTIIASIWSMPVMYGFRGRQIEQGSLLVPSFRRLESVYQDLKVPAGTTRFVQVEVADYRLALPPPDKYLREAEIIYDYVGVREMENGLPVDAKTPPLICKLCTVDQVRPGDPVVAYRKFGIAPIAIPTIKQSSGITPSCGSPIITENP